MKACLPSKPMYCSREYQASTTTIRDLKCSKLDFDDTCAYNENEWRYMLVLKAFCNKVRPFVTYYAKIINSYNITVHNILEKEIKLLLTQVNRKQKCAVITTLVSSFIGLAYEGISSFLQHKQNNALLKAVNAMNSKANIQHNKLMKVDDTGQATFIV